MTVDFYAKVYKDDVISIDKIKLFANLGAKLFQEADGLAGWQELIINARKKKKKKKTSEVNNGDEGIAKRTECKLACNRSCHLTQI